MHKYFLLLFLVGCTAAEPTAPSSFPISSFPATEVPNSNNTPFGASKNDKWEERGPVGFFFNLSTSWGSSTEDTTAFRYGWKSEKFVVSQGECFENDCYRTPVYERKEYGESDAGLAKEGDEYWYAWSFYVPKESIHPWSFFGQIIMPPASNSGNHEPLWMFLKRHNQPFCMVFDFTRNSNPWDCNSTATGNIILLNENEFSGKWHDIVLHIKFTVTSEGTTEAWVDGVFKGRYDGYTLISSQKGAVMKYGIYRTSTPATTIIYYDELRKGKTRGEVDIRMLTAP